jgi:hypothetical protein
MNEREKLGIILRYNGKNKQTFFFENNNPIRDQRSAVLSNEALTKTSYAQS